MELLHIDDYYRLGACCISKYVERLVSAREELVGFLRLQCETGEVGEDFILRQRTNFLKEIGDLDWCDDACRAKFVGEGEREVNSCAGLSL